MLSVMKAYGPVTPNGNGTVFCIAARRRHVGSPLLATLRRASRRPAIVWNLCKRTENATCVTGLLHTIVAPGSEDATVVCPLVFALDLFVGQTNPPTQFRLYLIQGLCITLHIIAIYLNQ